VNHSDYKTITGLAIACSMVALGALLAGKGGSGGPQRQAQAAIAAPERDAGFAHATAKIQGRLQALRRLEKDMPSATASPEKLASLKKRWHEIRARLDELVGQARSAAANEHERKQIEQFAALANGANERLRQVLAARQDLQSRNQTTGEKQ
jgi:hypothetical protein